MTELSRRRVLGLGLATAGTVVVASAAGGIVPAIAGAARASATQRAEDRSAPTLEDWKAIVGSRVIVTTESKRTVPLRLCAAEPLRHDPLLEGKGYSLRFRGARHPVLEPTRSVLSHRAIGHFRATLLPIWKPERHQFYQLIVDHRRPVGAIRR